MKVKLWTSDTRESDGDESSAIETSDIIFLSTLQTRAHPAVGLYHTVIEAHCSIDFPRPEIDLSSYTFLVRV
jgi:hypothetical protein